MREPQLDIYDPETLALMDQAFADIWATVHGPVPTMRMIVSLKLRLATSCWTWWPMG